MTFDELARLAIMLLGAAFFGASYLGYCAFVRRYKLSLFHRFLIQLGCGFLGSLMFAICLVAAGGNYTTFIFMFAIPMIFMLFVSMGSWIADILALRHGSKLKRMARDARGRGEYDTARLYEKWFQRNISRITAFGGAKEIDALEKEFPSSGGRTTQ